MNGKVKYHGTEKIEKKIYDDIEEKLDSHIKELSEQTRESIILEIREELQPETVPYDRLRLIEQRLHEISTTQDGIVREIVDLKTTLANLSKELARLKSNPQTLNPQPVSSVPAAVSDSYSRAQDPTVPYPFNTPSYVPPASHSNASSYPSSYPASYVPASSFSSYPPYPPAQVPPSHYPEKSYEETYPPIRRPDGWEYQEYVPASAKKAVADSERFVPARATPSKNDPFYFGNPDDVVDVGSLKKTPPESGPFESFSPAKTGQAAVNPPAQSFFSVETIKQKPPEQSYPPEQYVYVGTSRKQVEERGPEKGEYIIGSNVKRKVNDDDVDYNKDCEYIIAEKSVPRPKSKFSRKDPSERKERVISNDEDDSEIISCD
ncbi:hypothetical protein MsAc7_01030 [Methanolapillus millepedarum]|uniref:Uncharacterized protein n=1 Tax=Methanolapillus millepedarum TaxID=3028296 RepID=A0AA96V1M9_9EURY|nr:hypothetical protein MsAc7_01030 [Methanosarcinaceae archaeon Ac7]